jgi:Arc/MetJ-type ribon-helix-helix transcriptional regulator
MAETEKITINMSVVDLGQVDLLVEEGFYSSRTDFIRTATRNQLGAHADAVKQSVTRKTLALGVVSYGRLALEAARAAGQQLDIRVVGMVILEPDVTPELAAATIRRLEVHGVLRAGDFVKAALADRIK